jgi:cobalt-zinc-cadmium efflux system outer membrane protein
MVNRPTVAVSAVCVAAFLAAAPAVARAESITLAQALARAAKQHPDLAIGAADVAQARGNVQAARTPLYNPELGVQLGPAFGGGETFLDWEVSLAQPFELGGKRGQRSRAAEARAQAATLRLSWTGRLVELRVRRAFFLSIVARERLAAAVEGEAVAAELADASRERLRLGAGTQLEVNVAVASLGRARAQRTTSARAYVHARAELAAAIGAPANEDLEPGGELPPLTLPSGSTAEAFVARALASRPDLDATQREREAARADLAYADALAYPDASLGVSYGHSGLDPSDTVLFGLTFTLPVWNRQAGQRASARAGLTRAETVERAARVEAERLAREAYAGYQLALEAVQGFDREVVGSLDENLALARTSYTSGKIGLLEFNIARRELVETRFAYLDALAELVEARYALELAAGGVIE